jgi:hypothetical protein
VPIQPYGYVGWHLIHVFPERGASEPGSRRLDSPPHRVRPYRGQGDEGARNRRRSAAHPERIS